MVEFLVCLTIAGFAIATAVSGWILSARQADHASSLIAAQRLAAQQMAKLRNAQWDLYSNPPIDEVATLDGTVEVLRLPLPAAAGVADSYATNYRTVRLAITNPPLYLLRVDCVWTNRGDKLTNTLISYRAPSS